MSAAARWAIWQCSQCGDVRWAFTRGTADVPLLCYPQKRAIVHRFFCEGGDVPHPHLDLPANPVRDESDPNAWDAWRSIAKATFTP